jgi:hypothetical protein
VIPLSTEQLLTRILIHARKADEAGLYTTGNTLWLAHEKIRELANHTPATDDRTDVQHATRPLVNHSKHLQYGELRWINGAYRCWECGEVGSLEYGRCVDCEEL